jgi:DNA-directed RNA polymerase subunit RPC12/RpoP
MALCDICNAPGVGTVVKASDMSNAVRKGFDPFKEGLMDGNVTLMYTLAAGNRGPEVWRQSAISGRLSMSDWNICDRCMNKLRPYLLEKEIVKCRRCGRNQIQITSEYYCIKCDKSYWWSVYGTFLIVAIASIIVGVFQCNPGFWRWFWIVIGALLIFGFSHDFWKFYRGNLLGSTNSRTDTKIKQKQNVTFSSSGELESYTAVSTPQNSQPIDQADYLMDYEKGSIPIGDLPIGARVVDPSWEWEFHSGSGYTHKEGDEKKPVIWIIVAKNHYDRLESHVTLLAEELIGNHSFDNSTDRNHENAACGYNHWGESGTANATRGLRPWLNSSGIHAGEGFYQAFSKNFKEAVLATTLPNKEWENGTAYSTEDKVFLPSTTELGDTAHANTYQIGSAYPYFSGTGDARRVASLGGEDRWYWSRSPDSHNDYYVRYVPSDGAFDYFSCYANHGSCGVRSALNLKPGILVSSTQQPVDEKGDLKPDNRCNTDVAQTSDANAFWEKAIAAAEGGTDGVAVEAFLRALEMNPDHYISIIKPETPQAEKCWEKAVELYLSKKDAETKRGQITENHCAICGKNLGNQWHYYFESLLLEDTIGTQCPDCNRTVCKEHMGPASDGENPRAPCPDCNGKVLELQEGPAYSSLVEKAQSERRYRGGIKEPSALGRNVFYE